MPARDPQERARGEDREAALDLIDRAHDAGRIGSADRVIRKNNVAAAATIGELEMITRDIVADAAAAAPETAAAEAPTYAEPVAEQDQPVIQVPDPAFGRPPAEWGTPPPAYRQVMTPRRRGGGAPVLLALFAAVVGVAIAGSVFLSTVNLPEVDLGDFGPDPVVQGEDRYAMDEAGIEWMIQRYRKSFDTTVAVRAVFYPDYVIFDVPADGRSNASQSWLFRDGGFSEFGGPRAVAVGDSPVDLRRLDVGALVANLQRARRSLNVDDAAVSHVIVADDPIEEGPTVTVYVRNDLNQSGFLVTDLRGRVVREVPAAG